MYTAKLRTLANVEYSRASITIDRNNLERPNNGDSDIAKIWPWKENPAYSNQVTYK